MACCYTFTTDTRTATREGGPVLRPLDHCNNKLRVNGVAGTYGFGTVVKATATPDEVEPWVLGTDDPSLIYGMSVAEKTTVVGDAKIEVIRTGVVQYKDVFETMSLANTKAAWWPLHVALATRNIYVNFSG